MQLLILFLPIILSTVAIKIPVETNEENASEAATADDSKAGNPVYYTQDEGQVDSYLVPPNTQIPDELLPDSPDAPATYLLPPKETQSEFYNPVDSETQSDWYPIAQNQEAQLAPHKHQEVTSTSTTAIDNNNDNIDGLRTPSQELEPPLINAPNDFIVENPQDDLPLPNDNQNNRFIVPIPRRVKQKFNLPLIGAVPLRFKIPITESVIPLHLTPPKQFEKYRNPTKLYPKKYGAGYRPVPIPIAQFAEGLPLEIPRAKPAIAIKPIAINEDDYYIPIDDKKLYNYNKIEQKRKLKEPNEAILPQKLIASEVEAYKGIPTVEQETSETYNRYPAHKNVYTAPVRQAPGPPEGTQAAGASAAPLSAQALAPAPHERTEFRMHGMKGPHSYQFGYDTGKGKNRQFRYEERDNEGHVRGHYGYMDKHGKLRVVNYDAHPEHGFRADAAPTPQDDSQ